MAKVFTLKRNIPQTAGELVLTYTGHISHKRPMIGGPTQMTIGVKVKDGSEESLREMKVHGKQGTKEQSFTGFIHKQWKIIAVKIDESGGILTVEITENSPGSD